MASEYGAFITFWYFVFFCSLKALFHCIEQSSSDIPLKISFCVPGKKKYIHKVFVIMKQISFILTVDVTLCWQDLQCCQMFTYMGIIPYFMPFYTHDMTARCFGVCESGHRTMKEVTEFSLGGTWPHCPGPQRVLRSHRNEGCHLWSYFPLPVPKGCALLEQPSFSLQHNDEYTASKLTIPSSTHLPEAHKSTCSLSQNTEITEISVSKEINR